VADSRIPVIDLFAGPGGLGEGFSSYRRQSGKSAFKIGLSVECDKQAHQTLQLRSFYRQFGSTRVPKEYYLHLEEKFSRSELFANHAKAAEAANSEVWLAELGKVETAEVRKRVRNALNNAEPWILIGGPPCQAYSLVGRSRNKGIDGYSLANDPKATLYLQYLQIIADFWPAVFVMENVKGLLSTRIDGELVFEQIRRDLEDPAAAMRLHGLTRRNTQAHTYRLRALTRTGLFDTPADFVIRCEQFGIPQARHRIIVVGIRDDLDIERLPQLAPRPSPTVEDMLKDLPALRSGLSKEMDSADRWTDAVLEVAKPKQLGDLRADLDSQVIETLRDLSRHEKSMARLTRGGEFIDQKPDISYERDWFIDQSLGGVCNHSSRTHMRSDLHRYAFASAFAETHKRSPSIHEFPTALLPEHENIDPNSENNDFADRFRVQHRYRWSSTVTSHIAKDGHYYIHYSPRQCRSLTVREAARLQTFPDNYLFTGGRTEQYIQVGNAVPPLLAREIAACIDKLLAA
jgi:DNA (cytosine-5)-methyltransferase 1